MLESGDLVDGVMQGAAPEPAGETLTIPPQVRFGVFLAEMSDGGEPITHVHQGPGEKVTWGHILRLLLYAVENIRTELMHEKFMSKQTQKSKIITRGGG